MSNSKLTTIEMLTQQGFFADSKIQDAVNNHCDRVDYDSNIDTVLRICKTGIEVSSTDKWGIRSEMDDALGYELSNSQEKYISRQVEKARANISDSGFWKVSDFITFELFTKENSRKRKWNRCNEVLTDSLNGLTMFKLVVRFADHITDANLNPIFDDSIDFIYGTNGVAPQEIIEEFQEFVISCIDAIGGNEKGWCAFQSTAIASWVKKHVDWCNESAANDMLAKESRENTLAEFATIEAAGFEATEAYGDLSFAGYRINQIVTFRKVTEMGIMQLKLAVDCCAFDNQLSCNCNDIEDGDSIVSHTELKVFTNKDMRCAAMENRNVFNSCWYGIELLKESRENTVSDALELARCIK